MNRYWNYRSRIILKGGNKRRSTGSQGGRPQKQKRFGNPQIVQEEERNAKILVEAESGLSSVAIDQEGENTIIATNYRGGGRPRKSRSFEKPQSVLNKERQNEQLDGKIPGCLTIMKDQMQAIKKRILRQITSPVCRPEGVSEERQKLRQLTRLKFHLVDDSDKRQWPLQSKIGRIFKNFLENTERRWDDEKDESEDESVIDDGQYYDKEQILFVRPCDANCPVISDKEASDIYDKLCSWANNSEDNIPNENLQHFFVKFANCYQGLRTLKERTHEYMNISHVVGVLCSLKYQEAVKKVEDSSITQAAKDAIWDYLDVNEMNETHTEASAMVRFGKLLEGFLKAMGKKRDKICDICNLMSATADFQKFPAANIDDNWIYFESVKNKVGFDCCRVCQRHVRRNAMPPLARVNCLVFQDSPELIRSLNTIELMLIKKVRVLQSIVQLKNVGGVRTTTKGCGGAMVVVPTTITTTVNTVLQRLPSASNMKVIVHTCWEKDYLVSMAKVVSALSWLKDNNPLYNDVVIDRNFNFTIGKDVVFEDETATQTDADKLVNRVAKDSMLIPTEIQAIQSVNQPPGTEHGALQHYSLTKHSYKPLLKEDPTSDVLAFVELFPFGKGGMHDKRSSPLKPSQYLRSVLLNAHRTIASNIYWIAFQYAFKMQKSIAACQGTQARMKRGVTAEEFDLSDPVVANQLSTVFHKVRGFKQFWKTVKNRLDFHLLMYGPPTWFLTLNPNEKEWLDLHQRYEEVTGRKVTSASIRSEIELDPVPFSRYWDIRVKEFMRNVVLKKDGPLGTIDHWFWRVEYQHRGTQHVHCLLWARERPQSDAPLSVVREYIDSYVTCRKPDPQKEPVLAGIVEKCQMHFEFHSGTCKRFKKVGGKLIQTCRFNFPKECRRRTAVSQNGATSKKRSYQLARKSDEQWINDYNPTLLIGWNGNIDLQYCGTNKDVVSYVTAYSTKGEIAKKIETLKESNNMSKSKAIYSLGIDELNSREVGGLEMVDELLGHSSFSFDQADVWIPTDSINTRVRMLKPKNKIGVGESVHVANLIDSYYPNRDSKLEKHCLYNIAINFASTTKAKVQNDDLLESFELESETICARYNRNDPSSPFYAHPTIPIGQGFRVTGQNVTFVHRKQKVGRFFVPQLDSMNPVQLEDYYRRLVVLFVPWRNESTILEDSGMMTYYELFQSHLIHLQESHPAAHTDLTTFIDRLNDMKEDKKQKADRLKLLHEHSDILHKDDVPEELQLEARQVNVEEHEKKVGEMNDDQLRIFNSVINQIENQLVGNSEPIRLYVSGTAGVGKSFLIDRLADEVSIRFSSNANQLSEPAVLLAAPTALAAVSIKGFTLHYLFGIKVINGNERAYEPLDDRSRDLRRALFRNVRLIIIDEISMVGAEMFAKLRNRLRELGNGQEEFGGFNILVFGDLLQLPPVKARSVYEGLTAYQARKIFGGIGRSTNLWHCFGYEELTKNMRQMNDTFCAEVLARLRIGQLNESDKLALAERVITRKRTESALVAAVEHFVSLSTTDPTLIALLPTRDEVDEFNQLVVARLSMNSFIINATDNHLGQRKSSNGKSKPWQRKEFNLSAPAITNSKNQVVSSLKVAGGLMASLTLAVNGRVMLKRNIDVVRGLVNGLTGVLMNVQQIGGEIVKLGIRFDRTPNEITMIEKVTAMYDLPSGERRTRRQFPIELSFAATIHKAQGLTLNNVILGTSNIFTSSQYYVGASRVKTLSGLHLIDTAFEKVIVNPKALEEYSRLKGNFLATPNEDNIRETETNYEGLRLFNSGSDCFLNSAIQLLWSCDHIRIKLADTTRANHSVKALIDIVSGTTSSVTEIRKALPVRLQQGQQDVCEAFDHLLEKLPKTMQDTVKLCRNTYAYCDICKGIPGSRTNELGYNRTLCQSMTLEEYLEDEKHLEVCQNCGQGEKLVSTVWIASRSTRSLILRLHRTGEGCHLVGINTNDTIEAFGARWKFAALCEYRAAKGHSYGSGGHYVVWMNQNGAWFCVSDMTAELHAVPSFDTKDIVLITLARID